MTLAPQISKNEKKGFKDRFQFALRKPGSLFHNGTVVFTRYRQVDPEDATFWYDGDPFEFVSVSTGNYSTRSSFCSKGAKQSSKYNKDGFRPPRPYNAVFQEIWDSQRGEIYQRNGSQLLVVSGQLTDNTAFKWNMSKWFNGSGAELPRNNDRHRAEVEALLKLKDMKVNFGEALAESRSTLNHLAKTTSTLLQAYSYARRGKWGKVLKQLKVNPKRRWSTKDPASRWLEVQFGWTPLVNDIFGTYELSQSQLRERAQLFSVERNIVEQYDGEELCVKASTLSDVTSVLFYGTRGTSVKLYAKVDNATIANLTSLGLTDPLQVGWALVPFSFMIDWVLPVGSYLEALGATKGLQFVSGTRTEFVNGQIDIWSGYLQSSDGTAFGRTGRVATVARSVYTGFPTPVPYVKSPFSTSHVTSALALFRTIFFKR